jgi:hypothetical protein
MLAVAAGGPPIDSINTEYKQRRQRRRQHVPRCSRSEGSLVTMGARVAGGAA